MINGVVVAFNLIPALPLDGGRVLWSILWRAKGSLSWATRISSSIGAMFGLVLILFGLMNLLAGNLIGAMWQALIGMFLRNSAQMSYHKCSCVEPWRASRSLGSCSPMLLPSVLY